MDETIHPQAAVLRALAEHVGFFPQLPQFEVSPTSVFGDAVDATLYARHRALVGQAAAVLQWAQTMTDPVVRFRPHDETSAVVRVDGGIGDVTVTVWDVDRGELHRRYPKDDERGYTWAELSLDELAAYVTTGVLEAV